MSLILNSKKDDLNLDLEETLKTPNLIQYKLIHTIDEAVPPFSIFVVEDMDDFENLKMTCDVYEIHTDFLNPFEFNENFFKTQNVIVSHIGYHHSDGDVKFSRVLNYGSYIDLVTTSNNSEDGFQTFDYKHKVFFISVNKKDCKHASVFKQSVKYKK